MTQYEESARELALRWDMDIAVPLLLSTAKRLCGRADSYTRMETVIGLYDLMRRREWYRLLGNQWSICDNIREHAAFLSVVFRNATKTELRRMMTAAEIRHWDALPNEITIYRGCYEGLNEAGFSWTLSQDTAARFPFLNRYRQPGRAVLLTATVAKDRTSLQFGREEQEVIVTEPVQGYHMDSIHASPPH